KASQGAIRLHECLLHRVPGVGPGDGLRDAERGLLVPLHEHLEGVHIAIPRSHHEFVVTGVQRSALPLDSLTSKYTGSPDPVPANLPGPPRDPPPWTVAGCRRASGPGAAMETHPELDSEQQYLDHAYRCLDEMRDHAT